jgi:hypothetical protein
LPITVTRSPGLMELAVQPASASCSSPPISTVQRVEPRRAATQFYRRVASARTRVGLLFT